MKCDETCFAAASIYQNGCEALKVERCDGRGCAFYKTHKQAEADRQKAKVRLVRLGFDTNKYYKQ